MTQTAVKFPALGAAPVASRSENGPWEPPCTIPLGWSGNIRTSYADTGIVCDRAWRDTPCKLVFSVPRLNQGKAQSQKVLEILIFSQLPLTVNAFAWLSSSLRGM